METNDRENSDGRELSAEETELLKDIRLAGEALNYLVGKIGHHHVKLIEQHGPNESSAERFRWVTIGKSHLQQGLMALNRAVENPDHF